MVSGVWCVGPGRVYVIVVVVGILALIVCIVVLHPNGRVVVRGLVSDVLQVCLCGNDLAGRGWMVVGAIRRRGDFSEAMGMSMRGRSGDFSGAV